MDEEIIDYAKKQTIDLANMESNSDWFDLHQDLEKLANKVDIDEMDNLLETIEVDIDDLYTILEGIEKFHANLVDDNIKYEDTLFNTVHSLYKKINSIYRRLAEMLERLKDTGIFKHGDRFGKKIKEKFEKMVDELRMAKNEFNDLYDYLDDEIG